MWVGVSFAILAMVLHTVGTVCLGAGIFLAFQIFHLEEHWPTGVLLWAIGAWGGLGNLSDWPQAACAGVDACPRLAQQRLDQDDRQ